jgi:hypothetical protein
MAHEREAFPESNLCNIFVNKVIFFKTGLQVVTRDSGLKVMYMMIANVSCQPVKNFG